MTPSLSTHPKSSEMERLLTSGIIACLITHLCVPNYHDNKTVSDIIENSNGQRTWNLNTFPIPLHLNTLDRIHAIAIPYSNINYDDGIQWFSNSNGVFTTKSAYNFILHEKFKFGKPPLQHKRKYFPLENS